MKLVCNNFRPTFWAENLYTDSFLAVAAHINVTSCNLQFIKQLLQCSPGWSQQYKVVCIGQYINHVAANIATNIRINYTRQYLMIVTCEEKG